MSDKLTKADLDKIEQLARRVANDTSTNHMSKIAKESAKEAVIDVLLVCGIDAQNPLEMQRLMAYGKECRTNAEKTKKVIDWGWENMEDGRFIKRSFISEVTKHAISVILGAGAILVAATRGWLH